MAISHWNHFVKLHSCDSYYRPPAWHNKPINLKPLYLHEYDNVYCNGSSICRFTKTANDTFYDYSMNPVLSCRFSRGSRKNIFQYKPCTHPNGMNASVKYETVIYLGMLHPHYGHFITESLSRCWAIDLVAKNKRDCKFFFDIVNTQFDYLGKLEWAVYMLECLGVDRESIIIGDHSCRINKLIVPSQSIVLHRQISRLAHYATWRRLVQNDSGLPNHDQPCSSSYQGLYVSRRLLKLNKRKIESEHLIEEYLQSKNFFVIHPQNMNISDQIKTFNRSSILVGQAGSGLHNILFSAYGSRLIGIDSGEHTLMNDSLCALMASSSTHDIIIEPEISNIDGEKSLVAVQNVIKQLEALL